ncbi:YedF [Klebsiella pneumoniae]|uniref:YedF n=1 Tax=Klebsiella pneumoniae TaxID=573 RepID=A0A377W2J1_KLEPN|nr:YedF [Klebsiella pneumoniae]
MKNIIPDYRLDMVGEPCPYPAVATLEAMPSLQKGEILEVVSDCPQSINNIPLDARNHGYTVLDIQQDGPNHSLFDPEVAPFSRRRPSPPALVSSFPPRRSLTHR